MSLPPSFQLKTPIEERGKHISKKIIHNKLFCRYVDVFYPHVLWCCSYILMISHASNCRIKNFVEFLVLFAIRDNNYVFKNCQTVVPIYADIFLAKRFSLVV